MSRFEDKNIVVLGASTEGGMGEAIARRFAEAGAYVTVSGLEADHLERLASDIGGAAKTCDLRDETSIRELVDFAASARPLDVLVNAAGLSVRRPFGKYDYDHLLLMAQIQFIGPALLIRYAADAMSEGGAIVNFSSHSAYDALPGYGAYAAAKRAGDRIVEAAAVEFAPKRLRINGIVPSLVQSPMSHGALASQGIDTSAFAQGFVDLTPLGRLATPDDIAAMVMMMASDAFFETGQMFFCTGGNALLGHPRRPLARNEEPRDVG